MNAVNPIQTSTGAAGAEPSMEEILASIRRIIADDGAPPRLTDDRDLEARGDEAHETGIREVGAHEISARKAGAHEVGPDEPEAHGIGHHANEARETGPGMHPPHMPPEVGRALEPLLRVPDSHETKMPSEHDDAATRISEGPMAESAADLPPHPLAPPPEVMGLGSILHETPVPERHAPAPHAPESLFASAVGSSVTSAFNTLAASRFVDNSEQLSGLVQEMIRPLVKSWVDENLPAMVERLVVAEIERMARGGR